MQKNATSDLRKRLRVMDVIKETETMEKVCEMAWTIRNFSIIMPVIRSPLKVEITAFNYSGEWDLSCNTCGRDEHGSESVAISLRPSPSSTNLRVLVTLGLLDKYGREEGSKDTALTLPAAQSESFNLDITWSFLRCNKDSLLHDGHLTIFARIWVQIAEAPVTVHVKDVADNRPMNVEENEDLYAVMKSVHMDKVVLEFAGGQEEQCHAYLLIARSSVFKAILTVDMKERKTGRIQLSHIKLQTGRDLLYFLYNRRVRAGANPISLLPVAIQYDLPGLKAWCLEALSARVSDDNYLDLLRLADLHKVPKLHAAVIKYIGDSMIGDNSRRLQKNSS